jgi:hypothetical protein
MRDARPATGWWRRGSDHLAALEAVLPDIEAAGRV